MTKEPTKMTFVVGSTALYPNDMLFYRTLDRCAVQFNLVRVIAIDGSSVAPLAQFWCKRNKVAFILVLRDQTISEANDRLRIIDLLLDEDPHAALFFNAFEHWLQFARAFHEKGIPVSMVYPNQDNQPDYATWTPGITHMPKVPSYQKVMAGVRKSIVKPKLTPEERYERQRDHVRKYEFMKKLRRKVIPQSVRLTKKKVELMNRKPKK